jgi:peroxiredoxin
MPERALLSFMAWTELRMGMRSPAFRITLLLMAVLGWSVGGTEGHGVAMSAYNTGQLACQQLGIVVVLWTALGAMRDAALRTEVLILTKPQPPERLGVARFIGLYGQVLVLLVALFLGAILGRLFVAGNLIGFIAYGIQYLRAAGVLFFVASASYSLALLGNSPIAGALIGLYWIVAMAGKQFLSKIYFPWYGQNLPGYVFLGLALLGFTLWFHRRALRGPVPVSLVIRLGTPLALGVSIWFLGTTFRNGHDSMALKNPDLERIGVQTIREGDLAPGFLYADQYGKPTRLSLFPGKILLLTLFSPRDPDSAQLLARLEAVHKEFGAQGVLPIAICISEDASAASTFAHGEGLSYPLIYDWGTYNGSQQEETSPMALAYRADRLPRLVVTDRRHRVMRVLDGLDTYEGAAFNDTIQKRLREEPE